jgi:hypothetical protein
MKKLPLGEAAARQKARVREQNEKIKFDIIQAKCTTGNTKRISEARKKQMREYIRAKRGQSIDDKVVEFLNLSPEQLVRKRKDEKNAKARAKRQSEREAGIRVDKRLKVNLTYTHHKVANAKPKPARKIRTVKEKKMGKVLKQERPMAIRNNSIVGKIALQITPKLTVFIRPDQDPEQVKAKYLNR